MSKKINLANEPSAFFCNSFFSLFNSIGLSKNLPSYSDFLAKFQQFLHFIFGFNNLFFFISFHFKQLIKIFTLSKKEKNNYWCQYFYFRKLKNSAYVNKVTNLDHLFWIFPEIALSQLSSIDQSFESLWQLVKGCHLITAPVACALVNGPGLPGSGLNLGIFHLGGSGIYFSIPGFIIWGLKCTKRRAF